MIECCFTTGFPGAPKGLLLQLFSIRSNLCIGAVLKDAITLLGYVFVVVVVNQLGAQRRRLAELAERQRDELANEIELAAEVQQGILPRSIPQVLGFDFAARMYPAKIVAGDYYGFIEFPAGEIAVVVADVSGKGVAAGLLMPSIEVALRMDAARFSSTSDLLQTFNNVVCQITGGHRFISLFYGKLSPQSHSLEYTNAGHNPPLVIRAGTDPSPLDKGGPVLGVLPNSHYESRRSLSARETFSFCTPMVRSKLRIPQENNTPQNGCQGPLVCICNRTLAN